MPLILTVSDETLQQSFNKALDALLTPGSYDNPIKRTLDNILGYNGDKEIKAQIEAYIKEHIQKAMASPQFALALGTAMAAEMAKREVDKLKK